MTVSHKVQMQKGRRERGDWRLKGLYTLAHLFTQLILCETQPGETELYLVTLITGYTSLPALTDDQTYSIFCTEPSEIEFLDIGTKTFRVFTQKNFGTRRSIFVCCTEDIYKFVSRSKLFESSPCGTRPDSAVTWNDLFVTAPIASFWGGGIHSLNMGYFTFLSISLTHLTIKMKLKDF